ncbi:hypothetical protein AB0F81_23330 [Actinoplanes sp. NPDC024001]|uniref:hypothetical protein n=1 Tax=Actinoplanes sp. NPDC024001 TaxID=3154598 RepID=UPI00340D29B9
MIAWSPTGTSGDQTNAPAANGYEHNTTRLRGFSLTHVNGAGCHPGAAGDVPTSAPPAPGRTARTRRAPPRRAAARAI